jgi:hypothetical protein
MRRLAESGATVNDKALKEVERYTAAADQARLSRAALAKANREH